MDAWQRLDQVLGEPLDPQHWGDVVVLEAVELMRELGVAEWEVLARVWSERDEGWQGRCADVLCDGEVPVVAPVLLRMIEESPHAAVARVAADSLRTALGSERLGVAAAVVARVERMRDGASGLMQASLVTLLERLFVVR